jgi:integrating conjugative element protein (TIGR03759 family)
LFLLVLPGLLAMAYAQGVATTDLESSRDTSSESTHTPLSTSETERSRRWQLSDLEWRRYQSLMLGIRGSVSAANLSPVEVLGIHARDSAERRRYAETWARLMHEDAERVLAFQREYDAAAKRLYPGQRLINAAVLSKRPTKSSEFKADDRILFFTSVLCPACDAVLDRLIGLLDTIAGIDIYISEVVADDDQAIRRWAEAHGIQPAWVRERRITLNHDAGALQQIGGDNNTVPATFVRRDGEVISLSYAELP